MDKPYCLVIILVFFCTILVRAQSFDFLYHGFNKSDVMTDGVAYINPSGALKLTNRSYHVIGHAFHPKPIPIFNSSTNSTAKNASSFSTNFVFAIVPLKNTPGGFGFAFTLSPSPSFPGAQGNHFLGVFNSKNDGNDTNHIFMVEFDTVNGRNEGVDKDGNHIGININGMRSIASDSADYHINNTSETEQVYLQGGEPIQAWIDYDGVKKVVNVTVAPISILKPIQPLISESIDLSPVMKETMYAGFSAATGDKASSHYILGWSFRLNGAADPLNPSELPTAPPEMVTSYKNSHLKKALIAAFSSTVFLIIVASVIVYIRRRMVQHEVLEDWELDCPHRFKYRDLYKAAGGFKVSELIGVGGFGAVYKGILPTNGAEVAVKRIASNSLQGMREFAAEIESLGRLRHKHLVNLQGWCKTKNDLLLVYDYVPNGSLDSLLYRPKNDIVLAWDRRFNIIKGIAAGLLYLHEEWEQVVIHRDVKSSNVLIDGEMNGKLGDFGLARLYDHGKNSHTTNVVGTIGYLAPELSRTGKASTSTDVYAYGVLLLEVASGRPPIIYEPGQGALVLADWVIECLQLGNILDAVDPKLNSAYVDKEVKMVLGLGLLCSHPRPEARPTMRQVMRYLNGDESLQISEQLSSVGSGRVDEITSKFLEVFASDTINISRRTFSIGQMSSSSLNAGR
ncbi:lectin-domain containing receptor kinase VI.3 [Nicotiana tabacum]|uniref:non-specific serine/threonine protein kinase n=2 Tax=Nicotiana TaxID=4085 RepID=A0A1S3ZK22_TOBAC|nr:PREDICTED: lectin-domain containing receptor kinase VI.3-like [Nicotiana sylvestris]XP_016464880.1 PREDICTED: lectin-domain containing receptor kinase VI.3-like [Nicotiana tabacum]